MCLDQRLFGVGESPLAGTGRSQDFADPDPDLQIFRSRSRFRSRSLNLTDSNPNPINREILKNCKIFPKNFEILKNTKCFYRSTVNPQKVAPPPRIRAIPLE